MAMFDSLHAAGQTIILVTHEDNVADHAHRTLRLRDGVIESDVDRETGSGRDTQSRPFAEAAAS
jgi:putative ABC transport system ATP-binding protein